MIIRFRGGSQKIADYLRFGRKKGRTQTRDELDERVVLAGDLDAVQAVIDGMVGTKDRALHIVISFSEDKVDEELLRTVTSEFRKFAMAAYKPDEGLFYAEAHLPRIKSLPKQGGEVVRYPHIHIVIPDLNLLSLGPLGVFGKVTRNFRFTEAFQEMTNAKFGFASPQDHRRVGFQGRSDVISLETGDQFTGPGRDLKESVLAQLLKGDITTLAHLQSYLLTLGEVRVRNADSDHPYLNVKPLGSSKGINLRDWVFSPEFLAMPLEEKRKHLAKEPEPHKFTVPGLARQPHASHIALVEEWFHRRCREVKYLASGNKTQWTEYHQSSEEDKLKKLDELESAFYRKWSPKDPVVPQGFPMLGPKADGLVPANTIWKEYSDSALGQRVVEELNKVLDGICLTRLPKTQRPFSPEKVMKDLVASHGAIPEKLRGPLATAAKMGAGGLYRVLRDQMHWEPHPTWVYLVRLGIADRTQGVPVSREASERLWSEFKKRRKQLDEDQELSEAKKKAERSILEMSLVLSRKHLWALAQVNEIRRQHSGHNEEELGSNRLFNPEESASRPVKAELPYQTLDWSHRVGATGSVEYLRRKQAVLLDSGAEIGVKADDSQVLEVALRLAVLKWGPRIGVVGSDDFKAKIVAQAAKMAINLEIADPELQRTLEAQRKQIQNGGTQL